MMATDEPADPSASRVAAARPRLGARLPVRPSAKPDELPWLRYALLFGGAVMVAVHLVFGRDDFALRDRALAAIPLIPLLWETYRYSKLPRGIQLPFCAYALLFNYVTFSFPALFNTVFMDLKGPVTFSDNARFEGTAAVAISSLFIYAGMRIGEVLGKKLQPSLRFIYPPATVPSSFPKAVAVYTVMCVVGTELAHKRAFPSSMAVVLTMSLSLTYVFGATLAKPESFQGPWSRYVGWIALASGAIAGVLGGVLDPLFRLTTTVMAARWAVLRRFSVTAVVALLAVYAVLQPAKASFRAQVWALRGAQEAPTYAERIDAWTSALGDVWAKRDAAQTSESAALNRFLELDPVLHAFTMLPGRVAPAEGAAWMAIFYAPIPRLFWSGKPTTTDLSLSYGVAFNLQTELGARTTSILLSLIIDGYWNFGWPGIVFVSVFAGLWIGTCQTIYVSDHWALRASALAQFSQIYIIGSFAILYAGIVQLVSGAIIASWMVYGLSQLLATRESAGVRPPVQRRAAEVDKARAGSR